MSKIKQTSISLDSIDNIISQYQESEKNYKLVREGDGLSKTSKEVIWVEWNSNGTFNSKHSEPGLGRSLIMSPFNQFFTWQTTQITEILENRENLIKFKTKNSTYVLEKIN